MDRVKPFNEGDLFQEGGNWMLRRHNAAVHMGGAEHVHRPTPYWIGPATGPDRITEEEAQRIAWDNILSSFKDEFTGADAAMTVAGFVETKFVPEHVAAKKTAGRTHYQAILKHLITPEEVDRIFQSTHDRPRLKLKAVPGWPYLSHLQLDEVAPEHVQQIVSAAQVRGYSTQTVKHIRNVAGAIFSHARKRHYLSGDNPAMRVALPRMIRKQAHVLTFDQTRELLEVMDYPEREMVLIALLTGMTVAEICGLQWKHTNLTGDWVNDGGRLIPPLTIAVNGQWYRGEMDGVKKSRERHLPIPEPLLPILIKLRGRSRFTGPNDFVLASRNGTPVNQTNIVTRRFRPLGKKLGIPSLTWNVFRHVHQALVDEFGRHYPYHAAMLMHLAPWQEAKPNEPART